MAKDFIQCKAKSKSTGERCRQRVSPGREVCYYHGGATPRGPQHHAWKHGRYSKVPAARILELYEEARSRPGAGSLLDEIHMLDAFIAERFQALDEGGNVEIWFTLQVVFDDFLKARSRGDGRAMATKLDELGAIVQRGVDNSEVVNEILDLFERRRKLVDTEGKQVARLQHVITAERAVDFARQMIEIVTRHVDDRNVLGHIYDDWAMLMGDEHGNYPVIDVELDEEDE